MNEIVLLERDPPLAPGWFRIEIAELSTPHPGSLTLLVEHDRQGRQISEFALAPLMKRHACYLVSIPRAVMRLRLLPATGTPIPADLTASSFRISRVGTLALWKLALLREPRETIRALMLRLQGKRVRSRHRLARVLASPPGTDYGAWLQSREPVWSQEIAMLEQEAAKVGPFPSFTVIIETARGEALDPKTRASLDNQAGVVVQRIVLDDHGIREPGPARHEGATATVHRSASAYRSRGAALNEALSRATGDWFMVLRNGDQLAQGALLRISDAARRSPSASIITGDHDLMDGVARRRSPAFKPHWNEPYFLAFDYIGQAVAFSRAAVVTAGGFNEAAEGEETSELVLRLVRQQGHGESPESSNPVVHVSRLFIHAREREAAADPARRAQIVAQHLAAGGASAHVNVDPNGFVRVRWPLPEPAPLVSLIVPTRDRLELLRPCVEGLLQNTAYAPLELLIVDNGSVRAATLAYLSALAGDPRVRIVPAPGPFNFAAINNQAARIASGEFLAFINSDIEVIEPNWLTEMVGHAMRPDIGAVGAKLLYPTGNVQHAGVILGPYGLAGHAHRFFPAEHMGYQNRLQVIQHVAAVTAACMVVSRAKFLAVSGFDEEAFPVAFNDADLCLRLGRLGYRTLFTPYAVLYHRESASRAHDAGRQRSRQWAIECDRFRERWGDLIRNDPHYSEHLTKAREDFSLAMPSDEPTAATQATNKTTG